MDKIFRWVDVNSFMAEISGLTGDEAMWLARWNVRKKVKSNHIPSFVFMKGHPPPFFHIASELFFLRCTCETYLIWNIPPDKSVIKWHMMEDVSAVWGLFSGFHISFHKREETICAIS